MSNLATYLKDERRERSSEIARPDIALAIGAHPDDIEFGCGGTLAKWASLGTKLHYLICTDGSKGSWDRDRDPRELANTRKQETKDAASEISPLTEVTFLELVDGELEPTRTSRSQVVEVIRRVKPTVVLGHDPWKRYRIHPDHRNAGWLTTDAIVAARDPLFFPEHALSVHRPSALLLWEADEPDHLEGIDEFIAVKASALLRHTSQYETTLGLSPKVTGEHEAALRNRLSTSAIQVSQRWGMDGLFEEFKLITDL